MRIVNLKVFRGVDSPSDSVFHIQGWTLGLHFDAASTGVVITDKRTGKVIASGSAEVFDPSATGTQISSALSVDLGIERLYHANVTNFPYEGPVFVDRFPDHTNWVVFVYSVEIEPLITVWV